MDLCSAREADRERSVSAVNSPVAVCQVLVEPAGNAERQTLALK